MIPFTLYPRQRYWISVDVDNDEPAQEDEEGDDGFDPLSKLWERSRRVEAGYSRSYIIKNFAFGKGNWTWSLLPEFMQDKGISGFVTDPSDGGATVYATGMRRDTRKT